MTKHMVKKLGISLLAMALLLASVPTTILANQVTVTVDGVRVNFPDTQPQLMSGRTLVPLRGVFEQMGFEVSWDDATSTATMSDSSTVVTVRRGDPFITVDGRRYFGDVPPQLIDGRLLLPLRLAGEATGATVDWDGDTSTVIITTNQVTPPIVEEPPVSVEPETVPVASPEVIPIETEEEEEQEVLEPVVASEGFAGIVDGMSISLGRVSIVAADHDGNRYTSNPEDFYDILNRYTDDTLRVRTNTGYEARIGFNFDLNDNTDTNRFLIRVGTQMAATARDLHQSPGITMSNGIPHGRGHTFLIESPGAIVNVSLIDDSGFTWFIPSRQVTTEEMEAGMSHAAGRTVAGGLMMLEETEVVTARNARVIQDLGNFMVGDNGILMLYGIPEGTYRIELLQAPLGFEMTSLGRVARRLTTVDNFLDFEGTRYIEGSSRMQVFERDRGQGGNIRLSVEAMLGDAGLVSANGNPIVFGRFERGHTVMGTEGNLINFHNHAREFLLRIDPEYNLIDN